MLTCSCVNIRARSFSVNSQSNRLQLAYEFASNPSENCAEFQRVRNWGDPEGIQIAKMSIYWNDTNTTITIPNKYFCGLLVQKTIDDGNPGRFEVFEQAGHTALIRHIFHINGEKIASYWVVFRSGNVEFVPLPESGLYETLYFRSLD